MSNPIGNTCNVIAHGYRCTREHFHPGAHCSESGYWWPYSIDGNYQFTTIFTPIPEAR